MNIIRSWFSQVVLPVAFALGFIASSAHAATADPNAGRGKRVLYVYNQSKLEKARAMVPPPTDPKCCHLV